MRRTVTVLTVAALIVGGSAVAAYATATPSPGNGSTVRGTVTFTESPGGVDTQGLRICGGSTHTSLSLVNVATGVTAFSISQTGSYNLLNGGDKAAGPISTVQSTEQYPNGSYRLVGVDTDAKGSGFLNAGCASSTPSTTTNTITIDNQSAVAYTGVTTAIAGTGAAVSATVTDPNAGGAPISGINVSFALSGGTSVTAPTNASGVAAATLPAALPARSTTITTSVQGNAFFDGSSVVTPFQVTKEPTSTTVAPPAPVVHGQATQFTATVNHDIAAVPTGTVQFLVDNQPVGAAVNLSSGSDVSGKDTVTSAAFTSLSTGNHAVQAVYSGDANFLGSTSAGTSQSVIPAATSTSIVSSLNPAVFGQPVTITATVGVLAPGVATPTGGVQFNLDGNPFGTAVTLSGTTAAKTFPALGGGNHTITATYNGDTDTAASSSAELVEGVDQAGTATAVQSSAEPAVTGQGVSFTATVSPKAPATDTPTGTVTFTENGVPLGDPVSLSGGAATSPTVTLAVGTHTIVASYSGDANYAGSLQVFVEHVNQGQTTTTIDATPNPSVFGQGVTFSTTVSAVAPATGTPSGQVQFAVDGVDIGTPVTLVGGAATSAAVTTLAVGTHQVTVRYLGDADFEPSTSDQLTQTVNKAATSTSLVASANPSVFGQQVTFTAAVAVVAPGAGNPSGTITFKDGSTVLGTETVDSTTAEQASFSTTALSVGPHVITVVYSGDGSFLTSSAALTQTVHRAQTALLLQSSANPSTSGQSVRFTATVTPVAPGAGVPTGAVQFTVNGAPIGSPVNLTAGVATSGAFSSLTPGTYSIAASYAGDGNFVGSSGGLDQSTGQTVTQSASSLSLTATPNPANFGATVTFTATAAAVAPATGRPTGVVDFYDGSSLIGAVSLAPGDPGVASASFSTSSLLTGVHAISAQYLGNFNFAGSSASLSQVIGTVTSVTGLSVSPSPATFGAPVTLTSVVGTDPAGSGTPTGSVTFYDGSAALGTVPLAAVDGAQRASLTLATLGSGVHHLSAAYSGSAVFTPSTSVTVDETVQRAAPGLVAAPLFTYTNAQGATVSQVSATLTGVGGARLAGETLVFTTLSFHQFVIPVCQAVTNAQGTATCSATLNSADNNLPTIVSNGGYQVNFAGNTNYLPAEADGTLS